MDTEFFELSDYKKTGEISLSDEEKLIKAATILREGGLVAFPTETVYGLGGNALLKEASRNIYAAKGRPSDNPLIVHVADMESIEPLVKEIPRQARVLAKRFWPGPLTMIMEKSPKVPYETTGGLETVAIRMPSDKAALEFIRLAGVPVAGPSANTSGRPSPTTALHVKEDLNGRIDAIIDGGATGIGVESTIVDVSGDEPVLLRPGAITLEMLEACLKEDVDIDPALEKPMDSSVHPKAPGMKYKHYAPKAEMQIFEGEPEAVREAVLAERKRLEGEGRKVAVRIFEEGSEKNAAHDLFAFLRQADEEGADNILVSALPEKGVGFSVMNRMLKSAGYNIRRV